MSIATVTEVFLEMWRHAFYLTGVCVLWLWSHLHSGIREISAARGAGGQETGHLAVLPQPCRQPTGKSLRDISWPISMESLSCLVFVSLSWGHTRLLWHRPSAAVTFHHSNHLYTHRWCYPREQLGENTTYIVPWHPRYM